MIGIVVQYILSKDFLLDYRFGGDHSYGCHIFRLKKIHKGRTFEKVWVVADDLIRNAAMQDIALADLRYRMKQVDESIAQYRLLDYEAPEAL